ncbi:Disease resistance protein (CC-NBS-LRR class) family [Euphorbia peplus]|nr:Disease resistance protein (CC-NBS-LRR class) family [Euphorbia peplus]
MPFVGLDDLVDQAWNLVTDNYARSIAILGEGGIGKTTLMRHIHTKLISTSNGFHNVIWITVSSNLTLEKVQDDISKKIGIFDSEWVESTFDQKAELMRNELSDKKFALFLDDLWEAEVDLQGLGVPYGDGYNTNSKLIFTTRSRTVASRITSTVLELKMLSIEDAWKLFWNKVGYDMLHLEYAEQSYINMIARILVVKSRGLPLLLCTVGRAMASRVNHEQWFFALDQIHKMEGTDTEVHILLQFCLDSLPDHTIKSCLSYFSLFPEDFTLLKNELIDFWICEELLSDLSLGYNAVDTIIRASLFEEEENDSVKLLDMIRDFALLVVFKSQMFKNAQLLEATDREKLATVGWIAPMKNSIRDQANLPQNLLTFLLNHNPFVMIKGQFSQFMEAVTVLDLSKSGVVEVPGDISKLVSLQYLNLSRTWIERLPVDLNLLRKLKCLNLEHNGQLREIPRQVISGLPSLEILKMFRCGFSVEKVEDNMLSVREMDIDPLLKLVHIKVLSMTITCAPALSKFFRNTKLVNCTQSLSLEVFWGTKSLDISPLLDIKNLVNLEIHQAEDLKELKWNLHRSNTPRERRFEGLQELTLEKCQSLVELTWVVLAPHLKILRVKGCENMKQIISNKQLDETLKEGEDSEVFTELEVLALENLPKLKSIYSKGALPFRCLKRVEVLECSTLRKLPLNSNSAKGNEIVFEAEEEWWNNVWEDDATKATFLPYFKPWIPL